jgi:alkyl hydroperoxide reductase subunit AhpF
MAESMEKILDNNVIDQIREAFEGLKEPVQVLFFGSELGCEYCDTTRQLLEELAAVNDLVSLSIHDIEKEAELATRFSVDKTPGIVIAAREGSEIRDLGIQFSGMPSGYEFGTLVNGILLASGREPGLSEKTREVLLNLKRPLLLQVFVTPT